MTDKQRKMLGWVEAWERYRLTKGGYCQQNGIHPAIFSYWCSKYLRERPGDTAKGFEEVKLGGELGLQGEFVFPNGVWLEVRELDLNLLRRLCLDF